MLIFSSIHCLFILFSFQDINFKHFLSSSFFFFKTIWLWCFACYFWESVVVIGCYCIQVQVQFRVFVVDRYFRIMLYCCCGYNCLFLGCWKLGLFWKLVYMYMSLQFRSFIWFLSEADVILKVFKQFDTPFDLIFMWNRILHFLKR